jgi:glycosyltransferase involved in cell wall biosynthesis
MPGLRACVVVPARDEEALVGACVRALAAQAGVGHDVYELLLVLDRCTDETEARARAAAGPLALHVLHATAPGVGAARRLGMDVACERLHAVGCPEGLIACTDADSEAAGDWLAAQLAAVAAGSRAIGGRAAMSGADLEALGPEIRAARERDAALRLRRAREQAAPGARTEHHQFSGASMALTAEAYREAGPLEPRTGLEDEALERLLRRQPARMPMTAIGPWASCHGNRMRFMKLKKR